MMQRRRVTHLLYVIRNIKFIPWWHLFFKFDMNKGQFSGQIESIWVRFFKYQIVFQQHAYLVLFYLGISKVSFILTSNNERYKNCISKKWRHQFHMVLGPLISQKCISLIFFYAFKRHMIYNIYIEIWVEFKAFVSIVFLIGFLNFGAKIKNR